MQHIIREVDVTCHNKKLYVQLTMQYTFSWLLYDKININILT